MNEESTDYIPSQEHRFLISSDNISQLRYKLIKSTSQDLYTLPFYRETTLKGSLAKGKVLTEEIATKTDIDIGVFFDAKAILNQNEQQLGELALTQGLEIAGLDLSPVKSSENIHNLFASTNLENAQLGQFRLFIAIANRFISNSIEIQAKKIGIAVPRVDPKVFFISEEGPYSIYSTLQQFELLNSNWEIKAAIAMPFGMNIGDGLHPYRYAFFSQLQKLDQSLSEKKWHS